MNIDLRKLRHIVALAKHRSFSRAASELSLTQPALSRSIADLEAELGERLFDRMREGSIPTAFGIPIIAQAEQLLAEADRFVRAVQARTSADEGGLAFGAGPLVAALCFADILATIAQRHPKLLVKAAIAPGKALVDALRTGRVEFAVFAEPLLNDQRGLLVEVIGHIPLAYVVRNGHPLATEESLQYNMLTQFPIASGGEDGLDGMHNAARRSDFPPTMQCEDFTILRRVVQQSDAIWMTAASFARAEDGLQLLPVIDRPTMQLPIVLVTAAGRNLSPPARVASDLIRSALNH